MMTEMACKNQCNALGWDDIRPICAGALHTVGLKADGTIVAVGENSDGQCDVGGLDEYSVAPHIVVGKKCKH